ATYRPIPEKSARRLQTSLTRLSGRRSNARSGRTAGQYPRTASAKKEMACGLLQRQDPQIITRFRISPSIEEEFAVRRPTAGKQGSVRLNQRLILSDAARQLLIKLMGPRSIRRPNDAIPVVRPDRKRIIGRVEGQRRLCAPRQINHVDVLSPSLGVHPRHHYSLPIRRQPRMILIWSRGADRFKRFACPVNPAELSDLVDATRLVDEDAGV